jgi:hypothetical protein
MSGLSNVAALLAHSLYLSVALASTFVLLGLEAWWVRSLRREQGELNALDVPDTTLHGTAHAAPETPDES